MPIETMSTLRMMDLSDFKMGPDANQQSLIMKELVISKKKLEEENQQLRDELEHVKVLNEMLKTKLKRMKKDKVVAKGWFSASSRPYGTLTSRELREFERDCPSKQRIAQKNTFRNPAAPGAKLFQPRKLLSSSDSTPTTVVIHSTVQGERQLDRHGGDTFPGELPPKVLFPVRSNASTERHKNSKRKKKHSSDHREEPNSSLTVVHPRYFDQDPLPQPDSLIDRLAATLIDEYSDDFNHHLEEWYEDDY